MAAARLDGDRNDYHTEFGPTNVALHEVAVAVELGRAGEALRLAREIDAGSLSAERRGRFLMDVARAHAQRRQADEAVKTLEEAEALTPEQVGTHRVVYDVRRGAADGGAEILPVKVAGQPSAQVTQGSVVKVSGLVATPWAMGDRSGISFKAARIEPAQGTPTRRPRRAVADPMSPRYWSSSPSPSSPTTGWS
ncbi:MAG: hypothetical protein ACXV3F_12260 [Frankiaceae bacterium]